MTVKLNKEKYAHGCLHYAYGCNFILACVGDHGGLLMTGTDINWKVTIVFCINSTNTYIIHIIHTVEKDNRSSPQRLHGLMSTRPAVLCFHIE